MTPPNSHSCSRHAHGRHVRHCALHVIAMVWWRRGILIENSEFVLLSLKIFVTIVANLTIRTGLVRATMSEMYVSLGRNYRSFALGTYWARLSDREKALLQLGHTYGRSCVCVLTCLNARRRQLLRLVQISMKIRHTASDVPIS